MNLHRSGVKHFRHPVVGVLNLNFEAMALSADPGLTLTAYSAAPGTSDHDALRLLASWAATPGRDGHGPAPVRRSPDLTAAARRAARTPTTVAEPHDVARSETVPEPDDGAEPAADLASDGRANAAETDGRPGSARALLAAAVLGFFAITLDALVVNVALPSIRTELGGGITGLQWVLDGYTLMFAALLLSAGSLADRFGARRAFATGMAVFIAASAACGLAPNLGVLVAARLVQGAGAAIIDAVLAGPDPRGVSRSGPAGPRDRDLDHRRIGRGGGRPGSGRGAEPHQLADDLFHQPPAGAAALVLLTRWRPSPRHQVLSTGPGRSPRSLPWAR